MTKINEKDIIKTGLVFERMEFLEQKDERLGMAPLGKLMLSMSLPAVAMLSVLIGAVINIFSGNKELVDLTCKYMPIYFLGITIFGIQMACQATFMALGQAKISLFIALLRKVILLIPLAIVLSKFFGVSGVYTVEPVADFISVTATSILFIITVRKVLKEA